jgi:hypothetical protein
MMRNFRDLMIGIAFGLNAILLLTFMINPSHIGHTLRVIDDARFIHVDLDNGPILD